MKESEFRVSVGSIPFGFFGGYVILVWLFEVFDLAAFMLDYRQVTVFSRILAIIIFCILLYYTRCKISFSYLKVGKIFYIGTILILVLGFFKGIMPDLSYDTGNYHLLAHNPGFTNYFDKHYGLGNFQVWGFRLGDRLAYPFITILGYRMGTLFSSFVLTLCYYQIIQLLYLIEIEHIKNSDSKSLRQKIISPEIFALLIILGQDCLTSLGSYYVDVYAFPIGFEVIRLLIRAKRTKISNNEILYFALLNGIWFAFKMTNIVFVVPAVIMFIIFVKKINIKTFFASALCCLVPVSVYLIYNCFCTGNPIYPYFNKLFGSSYWGGSDFKDVRWGGKNFFEQVIWLFYAIFYPSYRQCEIPNKYTLIYMGGFITIIWIIVCKLKQKNCKINIHFELVIFIITSSILWGITTGIQRYYSFGMLMIAVIFYEGLIILKTKIKIRTPFIIVMLSLCYITVIQITSVLKGREWAWRNLTGENVQKNMEYVLKDQKYKGDFDWAEVDGFAIMNCEMGGIANWMNPDAYVLNLSYGNYLSGEELESFIELKNNLINKRFYDIQYPNFDLESYKNKVDYQGLAIQEIKNIQTNLGEFVLIRLALGGNINE